MKERIKNVMSSVFKCDITAINEYSSPDTIDLWDSLGHMNMIVSLEEEFDITLNEEEIVEMTDYQHVYTIIKSKLSLN